MVQTWTRWYAVLAAGLVVTVFACDSGEQNQGAEQPFLQPPSADPLPDVQQLGISPKDMGSSQTGTDQDVGPGGGDDQNQWDSGPSWVDDVDPSVDWGTPDIVSEVDTTLPPVPDVIETDELSIDINEPTDTNPQETDVPWVDPPDTTIADATADVVIDPVDLGGSGQPDIVVVEPPPYDCSSIPAGPFELKKLTGPMASEDLAFDAAGNVVGSNDKSIFKSPYGGSPQVFVPSISFRAGLRYLPDGNLVVCNDKKGELTRIDPNGVQYKILGGLAYPNGLTVDLNGMVYFTEHDGNKVWRVHPYTAEKLLLTSQIKNPNGVVFSPDYKTLYIDGFSGVGTIYKIEFDSNGNPGPLQNFATKVGTGWLDGLGVDICGNVYVCDYGQTVVYRITPNGQTKTKIIDGSKISGTYLPNMQWGSGLGGWDSMKLYLPDGWKKGVFEVDIKIPAPPRPYP